MEEILSVSELTRAIKFNLESKFPWIQVQGEISNFKAQSSGHFYFSLKDQEAQIAAVLFKGEQNNLKRQPKDGDHVILRGALNVYPPSGRYQITVREIEWAGIGLLLMKLEELKIKLNKMGYFKHERRKPLPKFPKTIGIVTSPTGAVIQDILNVLSRRCKGFHVIINPVKVQGEGAAAEIAQAIRQFNEMKLVDVMIVGRGGGSIEDLWAFNEEIVAQAIFESQIPIISAVGHETDHTIADYVADLRAPTPSAAAEIVSQESKNVTERLQMYEQRIKQGLLHLLKHEKQRLFYFMKQPWMASPYGLIGPWLQRCDDLREEVDRRMQESIQRKKDQLEGFHKRLEALKPKTQIGHLQVRLRELAKSLDRTLQNRLLHEKVKVAKIQHIMHAIDPKNLLSKGYSIVFSEKERSVIKNVRSVKINESIRILLSDGEILSTVNEIHD